MTKQEAKEKIKKLIERYEKLTPNEIKKINEMTTRKDFVIPLFEALGWDVYNLNEVIEEQSAVEGTVDYSFRLNNISQFLLEAKALKIDLEKVEWAKQSVDYAWNMGVDWAVLTDFEGLKLFNAEEDVSIPRPIKEFTYKEYLTKFEDLWILSKESFLNGDLDKEAQNWGIKAKRLEVTEKLAKDLLRWRKELFDNFLKWNEDKYSEGEIDEAVQRILDRLIFIRNCEDRKIEEKRIWPAFQKWERDKSDTNFIKVLRPIFKYYDDQYNSNLFTSHFCEVLDTDGGPFYTIINELYGDKKSGAKYNFAIIRPDVLGAVYEQYLGHILKKSKKKNDADKDKAKRKEQGIYYTPTFIVDYIVENTFGKLIKEKSLSEIQNLKILDPACGSGSFLIKAFGVMDKALKELRKPKDSTDNAHRKYGILSNIYGVDLDEQAIEITRLNLLLKAIEPSCKLPYLSDNTKVGNSLISGTEEELKRHFGKDWKNKKAFNWKQEFLDVFKGKNPGFDVIVGNPPYIQSRNLDDEERHYYWDKYLTDTNHSDIYSFFVERSIDLLKNGGLLGFIIPNTWLQIPSFKSLRKKIFTENKVLSVLFFETGLRVFEEAQISNVILILQKESNKNLISDNCINIVKYSTGGQVLLFNTIQQKDVNFEQGFNIQTNLKTRDILSKILHNSIFLEFAGSIVGGLRTGDDNKFLKQKPNSECDKRLLRGRNIGRYHLEWTGEYVWYKPDLMKIKQAAAPKESKIFEAKEKLLIRMISGDKIIATYDNKGFYLLQDNLLLPKTNYNIKYILSVLNSKLATFIVKNMTSNIAITQSLLKIFPIPKIDFSNKKEKLRHDELVKLADKMLKLNKELQKTTEKSDKWYKIKKEIEKTDKIIDQKVYELYGLTKEEIKVVEYNRI